MQIAEQNIYGFEVQTITGPVIAMKEFSGKVLLIVNVASKCGFTPQYKGLEELYKKYRQSGLEILGFPCNQFGAQEPGSETEIQNFCRLNYDVSFPLFSKIAVNGADTHPLYQYLKNHQKGILGTSSIKWNFTKFLVDRTGQVVGRFGPNTPPHALEKEIERLL